MNSKPSESGRIGLLVLVLTLMLTCGWLVSWFRVTPSIDEPGQATPAGQPPGHSAPDTAPEINTGDIVCEISAKKTSYVVGESPEIEVRLHNKTGQTVTLVGSLDGSDLGWRYPHCIFDVDGPPGHRGPGIGRCGNTNPLRVKDFVQLHAGESLNPFMRIDDYGFFSSGGLDFTHFMVPGKYQVSFRYSTNSSKILEWVGIAGPPAQDSEVARLFPQVARFETVSNSIELTFAPPPGGFVPGFQTPLSRAEAMGARFLSLTLGQQPILPPQMDIVWLVDGVPADVSLLTDLNFVDGYLASVLPAVLSAGGRWTHHVATFAADGSVETPISWPATRMSEDAGRMLSRIKPRPADTKDRLLSELGAILKRFPLDPQDKDPGVVVFVLTEKSFAADELRPLVPTGSDPAAVFRVTRRTGTWIPEKLIGHVRRPQ